MLTVWREKKAMERVKRGEIHICQELSFLVAICCRIPGVARQLCVRLSGLTDIAGMKFCGRRDGAHALGLNTMDLLRLENSLPRTSPFSQSCLPMYLPRIYSDFVIIALFPFSTLI